ncbi:GNAT family N-acetyltransferase [Metabacillus fastidiosus]|uniref:GNAT family N-acetyltransferase n=1 Tax=Metabacillus fastidiosus TaxID=1458 RepID=UPI003D2CCC57
MILPITLDNLNKNIELYVSVFNEPPWEDNWTFEKAERRFLDLLHTPRFLGFSYYHNEELVALAAGNCEEWSDGELFYLKEMCVRPNMQGQEIGTRLLSYLDAHLQERGVMYSYLLTLQEGQAASFYAKNSYKKDLNTVFMLHKLKK